MDSSSDSLMFPFPDEIAVDPKHIPMVKVIQFIFINLFEEKDGILYQQALQLSKMLDNDVISRSEIATIFEELVLSGRLEEDLIDDFKTIFKIEINTDQDCIQAFTYLKAKYGYNPVSETVEDKKGLKRISNDIFDSVISFLQSDDGANFQLEIISDTIEFCADTKICPKDSDLMRKCHNYLFSIIS